MMLINVDVACNNEQVVFATRIPEVMVTIPNKYTSIIETPKSQRYVAKVVNKVMIPDSYKALRLVAIKSF